MKIACLFLFTLNSILEEYVKRNLLFDYESFTKIFNRLDIVIYLIKKLINIKFHFQYFFNLIKLDLIN